jgi:hypothetical protein
MALFVSVERDANAGFVRSRQDQGGRWPLIGIGTRIAAPAEDDL